MLVIMRRWMGALRIDGAILVSFLILAAIGSAFAELASDVMEGDTLSFDRFVMGLFRDSADPAVPIGPRWFQSTMLDMTALGDISTLTLLTAIVAGYLLIIGKRSTAVFLIIAVAGGALASTLLKATFNRPRPDLVPHLVEVHTTSFPSGHAMNSAVVFLTLGALITRTQADYRARVYILVVAILLTLIIGFSRVYLGVHWPSDVMAGWMVGAAWATLCWMLARWLQQQRAIEPATRDI
jgi:undecaprenyl-diphosphatase